MKIVLTVLLSLFVLIINAPLMANGCFQVERVALLTFKAGLNDPGNLMSSWHCQHCCNWSGVTCDKLTKHVVRLELRNPYDYNQRYYDYSASDWASHALTGEINPALLSLRHLSYLDLSSHDFSKLHIPKFIGSFEKLVYLNLSSSMFQGAIPYELGNLSRLQFLDLGYSQFTGMIPPQLGNLSDLSYLSLSSSFFYNFSNPYFTEDIGSLSWLYHLTNLRYLDMAWVNLSYVFNWSELNKMHRLETLILSNCYLPKIPMNLPFVNLTSLTKLDLSENSFDVALPNWLWNLTSLLYLDLSNSEFSKNIPHAITNLVSLNYLGIGGNKFEHVLVEPISKLHNLTGLDLSDMEIGGDIANLIKRLGSMWYHLEVVILYGNNLLGNISSWIAQMRNLSCIDLSSNLLSGHITSEIGTLSHLTFLDLSYNSLSGFVTQAHMRNLTNLEEIYLSDNMLKIKINDKWLPPFQLEYLDMALCEVGPGFPTWLRGQTQLRIVQLSNTSITGAIPIWFWNMPSLQNIYLSYNNITGNLPTSFHFKKIQALVLRSNGVTGAIPTNICDMTDLALLDLSNNAISGEIPNCLHNNSSLEIIDLSNNQITGELPSSIGSLQYLGVLQLYNNKLYGEIPFNLQQCKRLIFLSLGKNRFSGKIPSWIGKKLQNLVVFQLSSNEFSGYIPPEVGELGELQILDLAHNYLTGPLPNSVGNFSHMKNSSQYFSSSFGYFGALYAVTLYIDINGQEVYTSMPLDYAKTIDLSGNYLNGQIPKEIGFLQGVINLNLSKNHLTGEIPETVGDMRSLESLDLSFNKLSGSLPQTLSNLLSLHNLNLSYNNFSGKIPTGKQLDTLTDPSIYAGNPYLCGPPINKSCFEDQTNRGIDFAQDSSAREMERFYLAVALGCIVGFWCLWAALIFHNSCKVAYFQLVDRLFDKMYVHTMLAMRRFGW